MHKSIISKLWSRKDVKVIEKILFGVKTDNPGVCSISGVCKLRPASENCAARGELRFLNRVRPANVLHVFWRCLIKSMSEINLE